MDKDIQLALEYWRGVNETFPGQKYARFDAYQFPVHRRVEVSVGAILPGGQKQIPHKIVHFGLQWNNEVLIWETGL